MAEEIRIGVSACLLGEQVRWDAGHKRNEYVRGRLAEHFVFVPVCPEVELGLGIPREPIRLARQDGEIRLLGREDQGDLSAAMRDYARARVADLAAAGLSGYILKSGSPSCGMERVKVWDRNGVPSKSGRGLFAEVLIERLPLLPVEEEGRLNDPGLRENFIERVFAHRRLQDLFADGAWTVGDLVDFHAREKYLLLAHDTEGYGELGRMVATAKGRPPAELARDYRERFMLAMAKPATIGRHVNVLQHMAGYFKNELDPADKAELHGVIDDYARGLVPLVVPTTLVGHWVRKLGVDYLARQRYLAPHPKELMLRNHV